MNNRLKQQIEQGRCSLGIEFGSTRIKAVLIDPQARIVAVGMHDWENRLENGIWTYGLEDIHSGLQSCYMSLKAAVVEKYGVKLQKLASLGISAMMHGYIALDKEDTLLAPFRTWRNTVTERAADELTALFDFNIPQRWSVAHFWQQVLDGEAHVHNIDKLMTLSVYVHYLLSGEFVAGIGDASGMFPVEDAKPVYHAEMLRKMHALTAEKGIAYTLEDVLPRILTAGENAGVLSAYGAKLLDEEGDLLAGVPMCPPEGDAGTGMVATNCIRPATGNISAGTSVFAMIVLERSLSRLHREVDIAATPTGAPFAMVQCTNCSSELNMFADVFATLGTQLGKPLDRGTVLGAIFSAAERADTDCGGVIACNYLSGEHITGFSKGRPLIARLPDGNCNLANFSRAMVFSAFATLKMGMETFADENIRIERILGHGGLFKSPFAAATVAAALKTKVTTMNTADEGGAWGMALLASFSVNRELGEGLEDFLDRCAFAAVESTTTPVDSVLTASFDQYIERYKKILLVENAAVENL